MRKTQSLFGRKIPFVMPAGFGYQEYGIGFYYAPVENLEKYYRPLNTDDSASLESSSRMRKMIVLFVKRVIANQIRKQPDLTLGTNNFFDVLHNSFPFVLRDMYEQCVRELSQARIINVNETRIQWLNEDLLSEYNDDFEFITKVSRGDLEFVRIHNITDEFRSLFGVEDYEAYRCVKEYMFIMEAMYSRGYLSTEGLLSFKDHIAGPLDKFHGNYLRMVRNAISAETDVEFSFWRLMQYIDKLDLETGRPHARDLMNLCNQYTKEARMKVVQEVVDTVNNSQDFFVTVKYPYGENVGWLASELENNHGVLVDSVQLSENSMICLNESGPAPSQSEITNKIKEWLRNVKEGKIGDDVSFVGFSGMPLTSKWANAFINLSDKLMTLMDLKDSNYHLTGVYDSRPDIRISTKATDYYRYG